MRCNASQSGKQQRPRTPTHRTYPLLSFNLPSPQSSCSSRLLCCPRVITEQRDQDIANSTSAAFSPSCPPYASRVPTLPSNLGMAFGSYSSADRHLLTRSQRSQRQRPPSITWRWVGVHVYIPAILKEDATFAFLLLSLLQADQEQGGDKIVIQMPRMKHACDT